MNVLSNCKRKAYCLLDNNKIKVTGGKKINTVSDAHLESTCPRARRNGWMSKSWTYQVFTHASTWNQDIRVRGHFWITWNMCNSSIFTIEQFFYLHKIPPPRKGMRYGPTWTSQWIHSQLLRVHKLLKVWYCLLGHFDPLASNIHNLAMSVTPFFRNLSKDPQTTQKAYLGPSRSVLSNSKHVESSTYVL